MRDNIEAEMKMFSDELKIMEKDLAAGVLSWLNIKTRKLTLKI